MGAGEAEREHRIHAEEARRQRRVLTARALPIVLAGHGVVDATGSGGISAELIGLADIIGAFAAGLLLDPYGRGVRTREEDATLAELRHPISSLFVPLFFVLRIGLRIHRRSRPAAVRDRCRSEHHLERPRRRRDVK